MHLIPLPQWIGLNCPVKTHKTTRCRSNGNNVHSPASRQPVNPHDYPRLPGSEWQIGDYGMAGIRHRTYGPEHLGRRKLAPNTSPNKTVGGAVGAIVLTSTLVIALGHFVFQGTELDRPVRLATLGLLVSVVGQLGDLMLSSVKRDLGLKDISNLIPGHGGLLDRFDSLILVAPAAFHYIGYLNGIGLKQPERIITGG